MLGLSTRALCVRGTALLAACLVLLFALVNNTDTVTSHERKELTSQGSKDLTSQGSKDLTSQGSKDLTSQGPTSQASKDLTSQGPTSQGPTSQGPTSQGPTSQGSRRSPHAPRLSIRDGSDFLHRRPQRGLMPAVTYPKVQRRIRAGDIILLRPHVHQVSCERLVDNSTDEKQKAFALMKEGKLVGSYLSDEQLFNLTSDDIRARYITDPVTELEAQYPLAFTIVAYHHVTMVESLLRAIYRPQNYYCIHVDAKSPSDFYLAAKKLAQYFPNVFVAKQRAVVHWGYFGVLMAEIICIRELLQRGEWKYHISLTGEEFPLKTNLQLVKILQLYNGANEISNLPAKLWVDRWKYVHTPDQYRTSTLKTPPPHNITIHKGDVHAVLTRRFAWFAVTNQKALDFLDWLSDAFCPEELFYSSLQFTPHLQAPGAFSGDIGDHFTGTAISRHKVWSYDGTPCHGFYNGDVCVFGLASLPSLGRDERAFFINKLKKEFQPLTYDCLEELYFNRTYSEYMNPVFKNYTFYANQYFVKNHFS